MSGDSANWIDNFSVVELMKGDHEGYLWEFGEQMYPRTIWSS